MSEFIQDSPPLHSLFITFLGGDPGVTETAGGFTRAMREAIKSAGKSAVSPDKGGFGRGAPGVTHSTSEPLTAWDLRWGRLRRYRLGVTFVVLTQCRV